MLLKKLINVLAPRIAAAPGLEASRLAKARRPAPSSAEHAPVAALTIVDGGVLGPPDVLSFLTG